MTMIETDHTDTPLPENKSPLRKYLAEKQGVNPADSASATSEAVSKDAHAPTGRGNEKILTIVANTLSGIFSPLFVPTFALLLALWITPLANAPERARLTSAIVVFLVTAIIPLGVIIGMMRMGLVSDLAISNRRQRPVPFAVSAVCYAAAAVYLYSCRAPGWLCLFFTGAAAAAVCALVISFWWKISAHALGMGGMCGMLLWLAAHRLSGAAPIPLIIAAIVMSGAVASSRIYLNRHTPMQTYAGWGLALVLALSIMSLA